MSSFMAAASDVYTQFLVSTTGANKPILALVGIIVAASFTSFHDADKLRDSLKSVVDDQLQPTLFDFIVIGGGSAGSIVAGRLSERFTVLLLEAGGEINPFQSIPALGLGALNQPNVDWRYHTVRQETSCLAMNNQESLWSAGKGLGGSSNLNFMIYTRGNRLDYDNWANHTGDSRWSFESVTEEFIKVEYWDGDGNGGGDDPNFKGKYHGHQGKLRIAYPPFMGMADRFVRAGVELGYNKLEDVNEPYTTGFGRIPLNEGKDGKRLTPFEAFIGPTREINSNLVINKFSQVSKILIDDQKRAYGVQYIRHGKVKEARARKEVVLSAGSVASPQILMLSGIGPKQHLESLNIPVIKDSPSVGQNLQDHITILLGPFTITEPLSFQPDRDVSAITIAEFLTNGKGILTSTQALATAYLTSSFAAASDWPDIQLGFAGISLPENGSRLLEYAFNYRTGVLKKYFGSAEGKDGFVIIVILSRPKTRGQILLRSTDISKHPLIDPMYYKEPEDIQIMVEGIKAAIQVVENTTAFQKIGAKIVPTQFPGCKAQIYRSDAYWECLARHTSDTLFHPVGTCSMGKGGSGSVVDSELRVNGVSGLRVIDGSAIPFIPGTNTHAAAILVGRIGAERILEKYGAVQESSFKIGLSPQVVNSVPVPSKVTRLEVTPAKLANTAAVMPFLLKK